MNCREVKNNDFVRSHVMWKVQFSCHMVNNDLILPDFKNPNFTLSKNVAQER
jgi:hypothetical protein